MAPANVLLAAVVCVVVVLLAAMPYVVLTRVLEYNCMFPEMRTERIKMSSVFEELKTGDILLFVSASHMPTNSALTQTFYSHAAMVVVRPDGPYTSEAQMGAALMPTAGGEYRMHAGIDEAPVLLRVKYYTGKVYLMRLARRLGSAEEKALEEEAAALKNIRYPYPTWSQVVAASLGARPAARHCFQHVAHLLNVADLTLLSKGQFQVCRDVCNLPGRLLGPPGEENTYESPVEIIYDVGVC